MIVLSNNVFCIVVTFVATACWFKRHEISHKLFDDEEEHKNV